MPTMSSLCPVNVVPRTAATPMVFSSTCGATSSGPMVYLPFSSGTIRGSTSKYRQNFSQTTWTSAPNTRFGLGRRLAGGLAPLAPVPLERERAEHDRLGRSLRPGAGRLTRRVKEVGQHPDAPLLDLGRTRVLRVVDEVAMQVLGDDPLGLGLHPRGDERRQVASRIPLECEVLADEPHGVLGGHPLGRERAGRYLLSREAIAEQGSVRVLVGSRASWASPWVCASRWIQVSQATAPRIARCAFSSHHPSRVSAWSGLTPGRAP